MNDTDQACGLWLACEHPERQTNPWVTWHGAGCRACAIKAEATIKQIEAETTDRIGAASVIAILQRIIDRNRP